MEPLLKLLYLVLCASASVWGVAVLYRMSARTNHIRRVAFITVTFGGLLGVAEFFKGNGVAFSLPIILVGFVLLCLVGFRFRRRSHNTPIGEQ